MQNGSILRLKNLNLKHSVYTWEGQRYTKGVKYGCTRRPISSSGKKKDRNLNGSQEGQD